MFSHCFPMNTIGEAVQDTVGDLRPRGGHIRSPNPDYAGQAMTPKPPVQATLDRKSVV